MIDAKQAVVIAKQKAAEMFEDSPSGLEEIERDSYKGRDAWSITLSLPRNLGQLQGLAQMIADAVVYRIFVIDAETGELAALKLREVASR